MPEEKKIDIDKTLVSEPAIENNSDLAKSNFLARMSHEMRTPLNAILGMSTIAQGSNDLEKIMSCLIKINEASIHLLGMINDVLDLAKIEAGKLRLVNSEFDLTQSLKKTAEMIKFSLDAKKQKLVLDFDPALPETVISDEQKLFQILHNLLSNAVKFTPPEGTITLSAKKLKEEDRTCTVEIKVTDTGIGMSAESLKKVFTPFEQLDGNLDRRFSGAGIGLALCKSIIDLFGGDLLVDSEPGKGSCFTLVISLEQGEKRTPGDSSCREMFQPGKQEKTKFKDLSILLAEDVEINREIVLSLLEDTGIPVYCAENGRVALEMYKASPDKYGLILMDIHMPEMDGLESSRNIRAFEAELRKKIPEKTAGTSFTEGETQSYNGDLRKQIPIIAMTANVFKDDIEKCLSAGMTGHMGKPIEFDELMKQLRKFMV